MTNMTVAKTGTAWNNIPRRLNLTLEQSTSRRSNSFPQSLGFLHMLWSTFQGLSFLYLLVFWARLGVIRWESGLLWFSWNVWSYWKGAW